MDNNLDTSGLSRRNFLTSSAVVGAGLLMAKPAILNAKNKSPDGDLNIAIIGVGAEGRVLMESLLKFPDIRFKAVCDIWAYSQKYGKNYLRKFGHTVNVYADYKEMLDAEKDLDAAIVATPDFVHAEHAVACMEAGLHVYCEKLMSNDLEKAKSMVRASQKTGKLLQIGHQRRSNPRYIQAKRMLSDKGQILGRITNAQAQWNRAVSADLGFPKKYPIDEATLNKYGYANMHEFRNWRWFKKYGGGPISDLGAHQIDIFSWFLNADPTSILAGGGVDYYDKHEHFDNVMAIYEYATPEGVARALYQVLTTTSSGGGYFENFMGINGSLKMSEQPRNTNVFREAHAPDWAEWAKKKYIKKTGADAMKNKKKVDVRETAELDSWELTAELNKPIHMPHLENFFNAIRKGTPLNCPGEVALKTTAAVIKVNEAVEAKKMLSFKAEDFKV